MNTPRPPDDPRDEPARDAWLSEALRHAPDADAAPSVAVRETILRQARAATASATPPRSRSSAWQRFNAAWSWLSGPRVAAAFASVMVATVVGLMWWDRPIDEALRRVEPPATVSAPAAAPAPAAATVPEPPAAIAPPAPKAEAPRDQAAAATPRATAERKREARPRNDAASEQANDARREAQSALAAPRAADETRTLADGPDSARAEKETKQLDAARERRTETAQEKAAAPALRSAPAAAAGVAQAPAPAPAATPAPASPPVAAATAPPRQARTAPLHALIEALAEESPRWRWQRDGAAERTLTPELQAWLQRLARTLAGRGANTDSAGLALAPDSGSTQELRLLRDGGVQAVVRIEPDGRIRIEMAGEAPLTAQLPAASTSALRRALDDATR